jgi:hypothetical protein
VTGETILRQILGDVAELEPLPDAKPQIKILHHLELGIIQPMPLEARFADERGTVAKRIRIFREFSGWDGGKTEGSFRMKTLRPA